MIVTAKDLTDEDHEKLNGAVVKILTKGAQPQDELLTEVQALVSALIRGPMRDRN